MSRVLMESLLESMSHIEEDPMNAVENSSGAFASGPGVEEAQTNRQDVRLAVLDMIDEGMLDPNMLCRDLLNWLSTDEVVEFLEANDIDID